MTLEVSWSMIGTVNKKGEALPRDETLWIASHRDSSISIANMHVLSRSVTWISRPLQK